MRLKISDLGEHLGHENYRNKVKLLIVPLMLAAVSSGMCVIDVSAGKRITAFSLLIFSILSVLVAVIAGVSDKAWKISYCSYILVLILLALFIFISGEAAGLGAVWICLLPAFGLLFFGRRGGTVLSAITLSAIMLLGLLPCFKDFFACGSYSRDFMTRFPVIFCCVYIIGLLFEAMQSLAYKSLTKTQQTLLELSAKDRMTGIYNHAKFYEDLDKMANDPNASSAGFIYVDINGLKIVNDTQNHDAGDLLIKKCTDVLKAQFDPALCYRMGGDEFIVFLRDISQEEFYSNLDRLRSDYESRDDISVAIGGEYTTDTVNANNAVVAADSNMQNNKAAYYAKHGLDRRTERR